MSSSSIAVLTCSLVLAAASITTADPVPAPLPQAAQIAAAKAGATIVLPAGTFSIDEIDVPSGVNLHGAGYDKTILVASGQNGVVMRAGQGGTLTDFTVQGAANSGILIEKSVGVQASRVRAARCLTGIMVIGSSKVRLENLVAAENRTGAVLNDNNDCVLVNTTLAGNTALGLGLGMNRTSAAFNNLIVNSPLGVYVSPQNDSLALDYNLYQVSAIGKCHDIPPPSVYSWRDQTGYDAHSLQASVEFGPGADFTYRPINAFAWLVDRAVTSGWGAANQGAFAAPAHDIDGQSYAHGPSVGAWEGAVQTPRPPDGSFQVEGKDGTTSAGLYTGDDHLVVWLFHNLPLKQGRYPYWLPARDLYGQPIAAGNYALHTAQAKLRFVPVGRGIAGNTGTGYVRETLAQISNQQVIFDSKEQPIIAMGPSESQMNVRSMNSDFTDQHWYMPGSGTHVGIASDGHGNIYSLRRTDKNLSLLKIDENTGLTREVVPGDYNVVIPGAAFSDRLGGLAALGDNLFLTDAGKNKLYITPAAKPTFDTAIDLPSPSSPSADPGRGVVWLLSGAHIVGVDGTGTIKFQTNDPVADACGLSVSGNRLALLSGGDGNVSVFDCTDPSALKPMSVVAAGATADAGSNLLNRVAIDSNGDVVALYPSFGVRLFGPDGKMKREFLGGWYNSFRIGIPDKSGHILAFDPSVGDRVVDLDSRHGTWKFAPSFVKQGTFTSMFQRDGKRYMLTQGSMKDGAALRYFYCVGRIEGGAVMPLLAWTQSGPQYLATTDFTKPLTDPFDLARWHNIVGPDGKPPAGYITPVDALPNGDLVIEMGWGIGIIPLTGFDAAGVPQYDWTHQRDRPFDYSNFHSPYTFAALKPGVPGFGGPPNRVVELLPDGSVPRILDVPGGHMAALTGNWGGTDIATYDTAGKLKWFQPLPEVNGVIGPYVVDNITYGCGVTSSETQVFDGDGLYLGRIGQPKGFPWGGKWLDNSLQFHPFKGADGKHYMLYGDFNECCLYWFQVDGLDQVIRRRQQVSIDAPTATLLASLPLPEAPKPPAPPVTRITIKRLPAPWPIDGDMAKWRKLLPTPQVIVTPETGSSNITGPADCSAVVRFACEGHDLYVQCIKFDDVVVMDQPASKFYLQDGLEMSLNSFTDGFKFNVTHTRDMGDIVMRDRFYYPPRYLDAAKAPRKIFVLDNARDVPERKLIESLYNVDLSNCKVIVTEFKIPLDADTYLFKDVKVPVPSTEPGSTMRIGMLIDDNDLPGGDVQKYEVWPATYGTFSGPEMSALATFE